MSQEYSLEVSFALRKKGAGGRPLGTDELVMLIPDEEDYLGVGGRAGSIFRANFLKDIGKVCFGEKGSAFKTVRSFLGKGSRNAKETQAAFSSAKQTEVKNESTGSLDGWETKWKREMEELEAKGWTDERVEGEYIDLENLPKEQLLAIRRKSDKRGYSDDRIPKYYLMALKGDARPYIKDQDAEDAATGNGTGPAGEMRDPLKLSDCQNGKSEGELRDPHVNGAGRSVRTGTGGGKSGGNRNNNTEGQIGSEKELSLEDLLKLLGNLIKPELTDGKIKVDENFTGECEVCGRELTNAKSVRLGIGPACYKHIQEGFTKEELEGVKAKHAPKVPKPRSPRDAAYVGHKGARGTRYALISELKDALSTESRSPVGKAYSAKLFESIKKAYWNNTAKNQVRNHIRWLRVNGHDISENLWREFIDELLNVSTPELMTPEAFKAAFDLKFGLVEDLEEWSTYPEDWRKPVKKSDAVFEGHRKPGFKGGRGE